MITARIRFLTTAEGGRKGPTPTARFACPFEFAGEYFDCVLHLAGSAAPGQTIVAPIQFIEPDLIQHRLRDGSEFTLWEGRTIARGVILEVQR